jgi:hypothetical protein
MNDEMPWPPRHVVRITARFAPALLALTLLLSACSGAPAPRSAAAAPAGIAAKPAATLVVVVRHAERADDSANTDLSAAGLARAEALVEAVAGLEVTALYSTPFCRTAQTLAPLARARDLSIQVQPLDHRAAGLGGCTPAVAVPVEELPATVDDTAALAATLRALPPGETVVVAGHSNTVPELLAALGEGRFPAVTLEHDEFDALFLVVLQPGSPPQLLHARFGAD